MTSRKISFALISIISFAMTLNAQRINSVNGKWLIELYNAYPDKARFFDFTQSNQMGNFDKLAGTENLKKQIIEGKSELEIRDSWEPGLSQYKLMRRKYLIYQ